MPLQLHPGETLLRLTLARAANFGGSSGSAAIDRPVALDVSTDLPYAGWSSFKGVLATAGGRDHVVFGTPATESAQGTSPGKPGSFVPGDGELLAFPLRLCSGHEALVFPSQALLRLHRLGIMPLPGRYPRLGPDQYLGNVPAADLPTRAVPAFGELDLARLTRLAGTSALGAWIVASRELAAKLWRHAVEARSSTAVDEGKRARAASLRRIEAIPAGTIFGVIATVTGDHPIPLDQRIQLGGWEGTGFGFLVAEPVSFEDLRDEPAEIAAAAGGRQEVGASEHEIMVWAFRATRALSSGRSSAPTRPLEPPVTSPTALHVRTLVRDIGARARRSGTLAAVGVLFAKAQSASQRRGPVACAHAWVLRHLFEPTLTDDHDPRAPAGGVAVAILRGEATIPADWELRLRWLRRYVESAIESDPGPEHHADHEESAP